MIRRESCPVCGSRDNVAVYPDGGKFCFSYCGYKVVSPDYFADTKTKKSNKQTKPEVKEKVKDSISPEKAASIKESTSFDNTGYRGISEATNKFYGVRYAYNDDDSVAEVFYPITRDNELSGYKVREHPKFFTAIGATGNDCDLFGAFRFRSGGKYVLVTEGEHDTLAAYQMFKEYSDSKNSDFVTAVVSITVGAGNPAKQLALNYDFLNSFETIVIGFDADQAGEDSLEKIMSSLPKGKVKIARWTRYKDANKYLEEGAQKAFLSDFYNAKTYVPAGVVASSDLYDKILSQASVQKVSLPPFAKKLEDMLGGGLTLGHIYNIAAQTGIGKTSTVNEFIHYWIFNSPHLIGIVSMELNSGQYGEVLLSRHIKQKLARLNEDEKSIALKSESIRKKADELFNNEDGSPRFYLVDDRDGSVEQLQGVIEEMIIGSGVKIIVLDVLQDIIEGMSNEEQGIFMKWCKSMIKSHSVSFVLINHMRKKSDGTNSLEVSEDDIHGSSTIMKSSSANILLSRNKNAEDDVDRNTTFVMLSKNRIMGDTGPAGKWYYDKCTHVMHDFDDYFEHNPRPISSVSQNNGFF